MGKSLEQMDQVFGDSRSEEEQSRRYEIEGALLRTENEGTAIMFQTQWTERKSPWSLVITRE